MGCCVSTDNSTGGTPNASHSNGNRNYTSKSPPPALQEEETVKEVLSETPTAVPRRRPVPSYLQSRRNEYPFIKTAPLLLPEVSKAIAEERKLRNGYQKSYAECSSEDVSEICSTVSESASISTAVTDRMDNSNIGRMRHNSPARGKNQSFPGEVRRDRTPRKSPGRSNEPSPSRIRQVPAQGHGSRKYGNGESSGRRRSRSPVMQADSGSSMYGMGRGQARKTGISPGRIGSGSVGRNTRTDERKEDGDDRWPLPAGNESLEDPLVALECFIFL